jgi:nitroreductase
MEVIEAIHSRHSIKKMKPDEPPREMIEQLLSAAVQAPNHHHVRPWRFVVMTGQARNRLGEIMAASQGQRRPDLPPETFNKTRGLPLRAPVLIAVGVDKPGLPTVIETENLSAASAACENLLLAAHALGLGGMWRTGEWASDVNVKDFLGFAPDQYIAAFLYIGWAETEMEFPPRPGFEDRTVWMES